MKTERHSGALVLWAFFTMLLTSSCSTSGGTEPSEELTLAREEAPSVTAFIARQGLQRPVAARPGADAEIRSFDAAGRVMDVRELTPVERAQMVRLIRNMMATSRRPMEGASSSPPLTGKGLEGSHLAAGPPGDTTVVVEFEGQNYEVEAVSGGGVSVVAISGPGDVSVSASWGYFAVSGDTTTFTSLVGQVYEDGLLVEEIYASSEVLTDLNEEILETAPAMELIMGCSFARSVLRFTALGAGYLWIRTIVTKSFLDGAEAVAATISLMIAYREWACECRGACYETAPPLGLAWEDPFRSGSGWLWPRHNQALGPCESMGGILAG